MEYSDPAASQSSRRALQRTLVVAIVIVLLAAGYRVLERGLAPAPPAPASPPLMAAHPSFLYGRVTTVGGTTYEGRLRFGGDEEALWSHYFNGVRKGNPWAVLVPRERPSESRREVRLFGLRLSRREPSVDLRRPLMVRFGDIVRIDAVGDGVRALLEQGIRYAPELRVTLKSGTVVVLDRFSADDFADGVRIWDETHGVVDLDEGRIRTIEFLPSPKRGEVPDRLYGTVRTRQGSFTGFVQWDRREALSHDTLVARTADGSLRLAFGDLRAVERHGAVGVLVTLHNGREIAFSGTGPDGRGYRDLYVDDPRYGRVLVSWEAFERVDFGPSGSGLAYDDFPPGGPLTGRVTTRDGRRLVGRLVYDLDESETTETLDAPFQGVDYTIPFALIASVEIPEREAHARVMLHSGEQLLLERAGDVGAENAGLLIFAEGRERPEYVSWADVARVDFDQPMTTYPPVDESLAAMALRSPR